MFNILFLIFTFVQLINSNSITSIQLYQYFNAQNHNTNRYEGVTSNAASDLIIRRGGVVNMAVRLKQPFNSQFSRLELKMMFGYQPSIHDGSMFNVPIVQNGNNNSWSARIHEIKNNQVDFRLQISNDAPVGGWRINWKLIENGKVTSEVTAPNSIYILFNPWSSSDSVFMPDNSDLQEYILNEFGVYYSGSLYAPEGREWYYDQFKKESLQSAIFLLDKSGLTTQQRKDPIQVSRAISRMANSNDDNGVVYGKWTEPYYPEKAPWEWLGSGQILEQFVKTGGTPVKYGQCWVFAGITTTIARTLGIPSRTITNFASAHDTDSSLTIDRFYMPDGAEVKDVNHDSIWNFHVWSEVWIARPDLPGRYSRRNWQAIDATPQELSRGLFQLGPANVIATKQGDINFSYDLPFLYSEVNSDQISWVKDFQTGRWRKFNVDTYSVGQLILTKSKSVGIDYTPYVLTPEYKFREGTADERESIMKAGRIMNIKYVYDPSISLRARKGDILFKFNSENKQDIGNDMMVTYTITNKVNSERTVKLKLTIKSIYYSGRDANEMKEINETLDLKPKEIRNFTIIIPVSEYLNKGVEFSHFKAMAFLTVKEKPQDIAEETIIVMSKPKLILTLSGVEKVGSKLTRIVTFKNPLQNIPLTNCKLKNKETAITEEMEELINDIGPNKKVSLSFVSIAKKPGKSVLVMQLDCKELFDIRGRLAFNIEKKN